MNQARLDNVTYEYTDPREITVWVNTYVETEVKMYVDFKEYDDGEGDEYDAAQNFKDQVLDLEFMDKIYRGGIKGSTQVITHEEVYAEFS